MTKKKITPLRPLPVHGLLKLDEEHAAHLRQWKINVMFEMLAARDFPVALSSLRALSEQPELKANFWFEVALFFAGELAPQILKVSERGIVWHQDVLHNLAADFLFEQDGKPASKRAIMKRLATAPEYAERWGAFSWETLRDRLPQALREPLVLAALADATGCLRARFIAACAHLGAAV